MSNRVLPRSSWLVATALLLAACSDGGGDTGQISVGVTDSPVDVAEAVVVQFTGVELKPQNGPAFTIPFDVPKTIDLLDYQNGERAMLLDEEEVPAGEYNWMRLLVQADPEEAADSYITIGGADCELEIPSGDERGLQMIRGFTVGVGSLTDFTIDFILPKSVLHPPGQTTEVPVCDGQAYVLKPVVRLVDSLEVGTISGAVDPNLIIAACGESVENGVYPGNVYLFGPVTDTYLGTPDDYDVAENDPIDALTSAMVDPDTFSYTIGFVPAGDYRVAYTCDADEALVDADDPNDPELAEFTPPEGALVTVTAGATATVDFSPP